MHRFLLIAALSLSAPYAATAANLSPASATYDVSRGGKVIGEARLTLSADGRDGWTLVSDTHGTAGMARMLGLDVHEESHFRERDGRLESLRYEYRQDAAIKHKERRIDFDWNAGEARVVDNDKDYRYPVRPGTIDRHTVTLAVGQALARGDSEVTLSVAVKDHTEEQRYAIGAEESLRLPGGDARAVKVERNDEGGGSRIASWFRPGDTLPLRVEQPQKDGQAIVLERKGGAR